MNIIHSTAGGLHVTAAMLALFFGTLTFFYTKGTRLHKRIGYAYVASMVGVNATAFLIYDLYGKFGPFHFAALFSTASITAGMVPVLLKRPLGKWLGRHYYFMNWSVVGLYCAFWAETMVRFFPMGKFWPVVFIATFGTSALGGYFIRKHQNRLTRTAQHRESVVIDG